MNDNLDYLFVLWIVVAVTGAVAFRILGRGRRKGLHDWLKDFTAHLLAGIALFYILGRTEPEPRKSVQFERQNQNTCVDTPLSTPTAISRSRKRSHRVKRNPNAMRLCKCKHRKAVSHIRGGKRLRPLVRFYSKRTSGRLIASSNTCSA